MCRDITLIQNNRVLEGETSALIRLILLDYFASQENFQDEISGFVYHIVAVYNYCYVVVEVVTDLQDLYCDTTLLMIRL